MATLNWDKFRDLTDDPRSSFESLCRAIIHFRFARFGRVRSLANQPGVECHLELDSSCELGEAPRWWGWQCKWFEVSSSNKLSKAQRDEIESSLRISKRELPKLTDWVLWTRKPLSKSDADWFDGLTAGPRLHRWDDTHIRTYLGGEGAMLQDSYFGELVLTPEALKNNHSSSVSKIQMRWLTGLHQTTSAEREVRQMMGELPSWSKSKIIAERLTLDADAICKAIPNLPNSAKECIDAYVAQLHSVAELLNRAAKLLASGNHSGLRDLIRDSNQPISSDWNKVPRLMRKLNVPIAINSMNALADMCDARDLLQRMSESLQLGLVAIVAQAGGGKTQMAAEVSDANEFRPAGILLHGFDLHRGQNLDHLAKNYRINGKPVESMERLLGALDAAGQRAKRRLPIVIDGLNEAENPRDWQPALAEINVVLQRYPHVLMICTLRTGSRAHGYHAWQPAWINPALDRDSFALDALPQDIKRVESEGFGGDVWEAIDKYFSHFKIDAHDAEIPHEFLSHPLSLRLFCETINPERKDIVVVENFPSSLVRLMAKYVDNAAERIARLKNLQTSYLAADVKSATAELGRGWWNSGSRSVSQKAFRSKIGDDRREWGTSLVNLLTQQGVILRHMTDDDDYVLRPGYDMLGGYLMASSILRAKAKDSTMAWLRDPAMKRALLGSQSHAMQTDVLQALVALVPRTFPGHHLWQHVEEESKPAILMMTAAMDASDIDDATIAEIKALVAGNTRWHGSMMQMLQPFRSSPMHPLNANFLHEQLAGLSVADRDLSWTEWLRSNQSDRRPDLADIEDRWKNIPLRTDSDRLRAKWVMWLFTSTDREFRDLATRALYWFGRGDPKGLFDLCIISLKINDPYVPERALAAAYGVAMAKHADPSDDHYHAHTLPVFARQLYDAILLPDARHATTHCLMREYVRRVIELAQIERPDSFSAAEIKRSTPPYKDGGIRKWSLHSEESSRWPGLDSPFELDFANYTIGRLVPGRSNYDFDHKGYKTVRAQIRWRVGDLGWTPERFAELDRRISRGGSPSRHRLNAKAVEAYGQKYSQIAYAEMKGIKQGKALTDGWRERTSEVDIDPSFPNRVIKSRHFAADLLGAPNESSEHWVEHGPVPELRTFFQSAEIGGLGGPWTILDAYISQEDEDRGRRLFAFVRSFLVAKSKAQSLVTCLANQDLGGRWLPDEPNVIYTFGGEIPWCSTFPANGLTTLAFTIQNGLRKEMKKTRVLLLDGKVIKPDELPSSIKAFILERRLSDIPADELSRISFEEREQEIEVPISKTKKIQVQVPVIDFGWEGHQSAANDAGHATLLAKEIAQELQLIGKPQSFDLFTKAGEQATVCTRSGGGLYNSESLLAIRDDLLHSYLEHNGLAMVWAVWGERQFSSKVLDRINRTGTRPKIICANYQFIHSHQII